MDISNQYLLFQHNSTTLSFTFLVSHARLILGSSALHWSDWVNLCICALPYRGQIQNCASGGFLVITSCPSPGVRCCLVLLVLRSKMVFSIISKGRVYLLNFNKSNNHCFTLYKNISDWVSLFSIPMSGAINLLLLPYSEVLLTLI